MKKYLHKPVPEPVLKNQAPPTGQRVLIKVDGVVSEYAHVDRYERAECFDAKLQAEIDWVERFTSHAPSIGTHYERILSDLVIEYLPSHVKVGTGFIYDSLRETSSPQIDLLCYHDRTVSPIYRRGDFVIVQPDSILAVCEVKKTLNSHELETWIKKTIGCNMGTGASSPRGVQVMSVFAYNCTPKTSTIVKTMIESTEAFLESFRTKTKGGATVLLAVQQLCLPKVFMRDREEYVSASIERKSPDSLEGRVKIATLKSGGPKGVGPFFGTLTTISHSAEYRDYCSSHLQEVVDEVILDVPVVLISFIGSSDLIRHFTDAKSVLMKNKAYGARFSSFEDPSKHASLNSFASTAGFSWCIDKRATHSLESGL